MFKAVITYLALLKCSGIQGYKAEIGNVGRRAHRGSEGDLSSATTTRSGATTPGTGSKAATASVFIKITTTLASSIVEAVTVAAYVGTLVRVLIDPTLFDEDIVVGDFVRVGTNGGLKANSSSKFDECAILYEFY
jgi:hypothetical protein